MSMSSGSTLAAAQPTAGKGWGAFILVLLSLVVEGFDLQAANFAGPSIIEHFQLKPAEIGPLLSASLFGVLLGAVFIGPLGDRFGRRTILIACCAVYGVLSLFAALASSLMMLVALRFLIGIGLGAVLPNALALAGELVPSKRLASATGFVGIGITFGGVVAGTAAAKLLPVYGWPSLFVLGGILPLAIAGLLWLALPESPALKIEGDGAPRADVRAILTPEWRSRTLAIWASFAAVLMLVYLMSGWIPLLIKAQGFSIETASWIATAYHAGGVVGGVTASLMLSRWQWPVVALFAAGAAISLAILASAEWGIGALSALIVLAGLFVTGTQNGLNGSCGATYPAAIRATGLGWALGLGRVGSILGPLVGSLALIFGLGAPRHFFILPIIPLILATLLALWLSRAARSPSGRSQGD
jgi:AAHS family 4-hydroxybenzoate transporter-like MFS transporter